MKLWITRPRNQEVCLGGMRHVKLWVSEPTFDHRPKSEVFELINPDSGKVEGCVSAENGWFAKGEPTRAKPFLKQDRHVFDQVWEQIFLSYTPPACIGTGRRVYAEDGLINNDEVHRMGHDSAYEMDCCTHWKRFLLEIDLCQRTVTQVQARAIISHECNGVYGSEITTSLNASHFIDEDMSRPFFYDDPLYRHLKHHDIRDRW